MISQNPQNHLRLIIEKNEYFCYFVLTKISFCCLNNINELKNMSKKTSVAESASKPKKKELEQLVVDFLT